MPQLAAPQRGPHVARAERGRPPKEDAAAAPRMPRAHPQQQQNLHQQHRHRIGNPGMVAERVDQWNRVALGGLQGHGDNMRNIRANHAGQRLEKRGRAPQPEARQQQQPSADQLPQPPQQQQQQQQQLEAKAARAQQRQKLRQQYADMKKDIRDLEQNRRLWEEGKHFRAILGLPREARSKDVIAELRQRLGLWSQEGVARFCQACHELGLLPEPRAPWGSEAQRGVAELLGDMKRDIKQRIAAAEGDARQPRRGQREQQPQQQQDAPHTNPEPPAPAAPVEAEDVVVAIPVAEGVVVAGAAAPPAPAAAGGGGGGGGGGGSRPPLLAELFPFPNADMLVSVSCGNGGNAGRSRRRSGSAPHVSVVSGVFAGLPVTGVPQPDAQRIVTWPHPLVWNECYNGNLEAVKRLVRDDIAQLDALGYLKTKPTAEIAEPQRLGIRRMRPEGSNRYIHAVLPAPMGDDSRASPLHYAVLGDQVEVVRWLLKKGASIDAAGQQGFSALQLASRPDKPAVLRLLQKEKARRENHGKGVLHRIAALFD